MQIQHPTILLRLFPRRRARGANADNWDHKTGKWSSTAREVPAPSCQFASFTSCLRKWPRQACFIVCSSWEVNRSDDHGCQHCRARGVSFLGREDKTKPAAALNLRRKPCVSDTRVSQSGIEKADSHFATIASSKFSDFHLRNTAELSTIQYIKIIKRFSKNSHNLPNWNASLATSCISKACFAVLRRGQC